MRAMALALLLLAGCAAPGGTDVGEPAPSTEPSCHGPTRLHWEQPEVHTWALEAGFPEVPPGPGFPVDEATRQRVGDANLTSVSESPPPQADGGLADRLVLQARDPNLHGWFYNASRDEVKARFLAFAGQFLDRDEAALEALAEEFADPEVGSFHRVWIGPPYSTDRFLASLERVQETWTDPDEVLLYTPYTPGWHMPAEVSVLARDGVAVNRLGFVEFTTPDDPPDARAAANTTFAALGWGPPSFADLRVYGVGRC